jgi:hypothetical protein
MVEVQGTVAYVVDTYNRRHTDVMARRSQANLFGRVSIGESEGGRGAKSYRTPEVEKDRKLKVAGFLFGSGSLDDAPCRLV